MYYQGHFGRTRNDQISEAIILIDPSLYEICILSFTLIVNADNASYTSFSVTLNASAARLVDHGTSTKLDDESHFNRRFSKSVRSEADIFSTPV